MATCVAFASRYGGDVDEHFAESSYWFLHRTIPTYDPRQGRSFSSWTRMRVFKHLFDKYRVGAQRNDRLPRDSEKYIHSELDRHHFDLREFKRSVSRDAAIVIHLVTGNTSLRPVIHAAGLDPSRPKSSKMKRQPGMVLEAIREEMTSFWEWTDDRVDSAFAEVGDALLNQSLIHI